MQHLPLLRLLVKQFNAGSTSIFVLDRTPLTKYPVFPDSWTLVQLPVLENIDISFARLFQIALPIKNEPVRNMLSLVKAAHAVVRTFRVENTCDDAALFYPAIVTMLGVEPEVRFMSVPIEWLEKEGLSGDQIKSIEMPDDSYADRILKGDLVAINVEWDKELKNNEVYAI